MMKKHSLEKVLLLPFPAIINKVQPKDGLSPNMGFKRFRCLDSFKANPFCPYLKMSVPK